jgi:hypothetical protein
MQIPMNKVCKKCGTGYEITDDDLKFYDRLQIPSPGFCPTCRKIRRLTWRNENSFYSRKCDLCGKSIISVFSPDKPHKVYCNKCWWSDAWNPLDYGTDFDFSRPFFEQFAELHRKVPQLAMMNDDGVGSENCEYCQDFSFGKNCYLVTAAWEIRDSLYCNSCCHVKDFVDCSSVNVDCELVYESTNSQKLYHCAFLELSYNCSDCYFGADLRGCKNCFMCVGLRNKEFYIFNKPYSKEEYQKKNAGFQMDSYRELQSLKKQFYEFYVQFPRRAVTQINSENCTGDNLYNCKDVTGFDCFNSEYCKYLNRSDSPKNSYDLWQCGNSQWCCDSMTPDNSYETCFTVWCWKDKNVFYSDNCHSSGDLFGCVSLKREKFCIFNKKYTKEEYENLRDRIVEHMRGTGEWGEFFSSESSPFCYNETLAQDFYPLTKEQAVEFGYAWKEEDFRSNKPQKFGVPDRIADVTDDILSELLACKKCSRNFKIMPLELKFYKKMAIAVPENCPRCRREERLNRCSKMELWERNCDNCGKKIKAVYPPDAGVKVYCEECYLGEVL